ncbi:MAG: preprotein translocase subunit SecG [Bacteroidaceae bacterium]|nr:preprotein translocase subunit SecG [Bacteroidaceae bacterium]
MFTFFVLLIVLASVLMCLIVLIQNSKGGGLAAGFASSNQIMGVRKTTDFLEKATWTIAALMVAFSIFSAHALSSEKKNEQVVETSYTDASSNSADNAAVPAFPVEE